MKSHICFAVLGLSFVGCTSQTEISIDGTKFRLNGELTYEGSRPEARGRLMNVRMVNATFDDENPATRPEGFDPEENTNAFISSMDEYRAKGILAFTMNLQGGMPGYEGAVNSAFHSDGQLKPDYLARVSRVIEAANQKGMVIILGFFYQRQDQILENREAVITATKNAALWLTEKGYLNVMVEISNEYRHPGFDHPILLEEEGQVLLMETVRSFAPHLLVSTSGMGDAQFDERLAREADFILIHGNTTEPEDYPARIAVLKGFKKPIVFNEDWCFHDDTRGIPDAIAKLKAAFDNGASWGIMNQKRNQTYPFQFGIDVPSAGANEALNFEVYEEIQRLTGTSP
jgi:hypothetical protein